MPTLLHPRGVVPILPQARIRVGAKGKLPKTPKSMHCTDSVQCPARALTSRKQRSSRMRADVRDAGDFSSPQGLRCAPDSRVRALEADAVASVRHEPTFLARALSYIPSFP